MAKIKVAIVGYGNIGRYAVESVRAAADMELAGVVRREVSGKVEPGLEGVKVVTDIQELAQVEVAILCNPTRTIPEIAEKYAAMGINTVDSFDIHGEALLELRLRLQKVCKAHHCVSIISAGWDPGSDSVVRVLMEAMAPKGLTYTNFGPGMSMGHSVAARAIDGVRDALSMTIPLGTGVHRRMVYVELAEGASYETVASAIKADPYFSKDETHVMAVESVSALRDMGHGVAMERKGVSGGTQNQRFRFEMSINNPALTAQVLTACARASLMQQPGAYTMPEVPVLDLLPGNRNELIKRLV